MSDNAINHPHDRTGIDQMLELLSCIIEGQTAMYISTPITTGNRFVQWYKEHGAKLDRESKKYHDEHFQNVVLPNLEEGKKKITHLRQQLNSFLIDPTQFHYPEWTQDDFRFFWGNVIQRHVKTIVFLDGWQYSKGSAFEFLVATHAGIKKLSEDLCELDPQTGKTLIEQAIAEYHKNSLPTDYLERITGELERDHAWEVEKKNVIAIHSTSKRETKDYFKDEILDSLSKVGNVAQFVSFGADITLPQRFSRVKGFEPNFYFSTPEKAIANLLETSPEGTVNIRSFSPGNPKGEPLVYGLRDIDEIKKILHQKALENKITIVNETINITDGGVSGVLIGNVLEFSPGDTPKCVDKPGVCRLSRQLGLHILENVYGFHPLLNFPLPYRVEFSIHPQKRGLRQEHTILWELEEVNAPDMEPEMSWPNNFSRLLGDKAYGLLIADAIGLPVPLTTVITRQIAPFTLGRKTGTAEIWLRTCPEFRVPGKYPTFFGWRDPFLLMAEEDAKLEKNRDLCQIVSVLSQEAVHPEFSGSLLTTHADGSEPFIEGVSGRGDLFMVGEVAPMSLPNEVKTAVKKIYDMAFKILGPIEIEWVHDGEKAWVVQLHKSKTMTVSEIIYPGEPKGFFRFQVKEGLEALRKLIPRLKEEALGIILVGDIGITSHFGDIVRKAEIPARLEK